VQLVVVLINGFGELCNFVGEYVLLLLLDLVDILSLFR
jgi:hypothetical protein